MENVNKNVQLFLKDDKIKDEDYKAKIRMLDDKVQQMLLWSTICSIWSYLILIAIIARIYASFHGNRPLLLFGSLVSIYIFMSILIFVAWKSTTYKRSSFYITSKAYLVYQINKLAGQRKLIFFYLVEYALLLGVSSIFFFTDVQHGLTILLKLTVPVSIVTYVLGLYFIVNFTRQMKKLELMNRQIDHIIMANINQN